MGLLLGKLMSKARKSDIGFGIHKNCVILSVSNEVKRNKDGEIIKRNCSTVFGQKNEEGSIVAEKVISWFNVDNTSEYAYDNFFNQLDQLTAIVDTYVDKNEEGDVWEKAIDAIFEDEEVDCGSGSSEDIEIGLREAIADKATCKSLIKQIGDVYVEIITDLIGKDSQAIKLKITFDPKGKYAQQPKYDGFIESMEVSDEDSKLRITKTEEEYRQKSLNVESAPKTKVGKL